MATFTHAQLEDLWLLAGGLPQWADTAAAIAQAESGGCQYAKAGPTDDRPVKQCTYRKTTTENSYGLWQINRRAHPTYTAKSLYTPTGNANAAVAIANGGTSFTPWTTYTNGAYKQYLQNPGGTTPQPGTGAAGVGSASVENRLPRGFDGWRDFNHGLASDLPTALRRAKHVRRGALQRLQRLSKVR